MKATKITIYIVATFHRMRVEIKVKTKIKTIEMIMTTKYPTIINEKVSMIIKTFHKRTDLNIILSNNIAHNMPN